MAIRFSKENFIEKAKSIHGEKYDYSLVEYKNSHTDIIIICSIHGNFKQLPLAHLQQKQGCPHCAGVHKLPLKEWINRAKKIHGSKYKYLIKNNKIIIFCPIHGELSQSIKNHIKGHGCQSCAIEKIQNDNQNIFKNKLLEEFKILYDNKYDYSLNKTFNHYNKISIICPIHGIFLKSIESHKKGSECNKCKKSVFSIGESKIEKWLKNNNINYIPQKRFKDCRYKNPLPFDFYLPDHNICIEYDGVGHFRPKVYSSKSTEEEAIIELIETQKRDKIKTDYCINSGILLLRIHYLDLNNINNILNNTITKFNII